MSNKELPDISVGDFAMDILKDMAKNPSQALKPSLKESTLQSANAPDISRVKVSNDFVALVTEGKKPQPVKSKPASKITESTEDKVESLINRLSDLLVEAKQVIKEMSPGCTTVGNIGTTGSRIKNILNKKKRARSY